MEIATTTGQTYQSADTGLGTTYERYALNRVLARLCEQYQIQTVLEGPGDGMTGIPGLNSLIFALHHATVALALVDPEQAKIAGDTWAHYVSPGQRAQITVGDRDQLSRFPAAAYDLVWNFNVISRYPDPPALLEQMARVSKKWVLFFGLNSSNYSFPIHALHHRVARQEWDHGPMEYLSPGGWVKRCEQMGLRVQEVIHVDCPWWPDIVDFGQLIADFFPFLRTAAKRARPENRLRWQSDQLPYYHLEQHPALAERMERLAVFENSRIGWVKRKFAHHFGILAVKG